MELVLLVSLSFSFFLSIPQDISYLLYRFPLNLPVFLYTSLFWCPFISLLLIRVCFHVISSFVLNFVSSLTCFHIFSFRICYFPLFVLLFNTSFSILVFGASSCSSSTPYYLHIHIPFTYNFVASAPFLFSPPFQPLIENLTLLYLFSSHMPVFVTVSPALLPCRPRTLSQVLASLTWSLRYWNFVDQGKIWVSLPCLVSVVGAGVGRVQLTLPRTEGKWREDLY